MHDKPAGGQPLLFITEDGVTTGVGSTSDLPDPSRATVDQVLASVQSDPFHGWRFSKAEDGSLAVEMEWLGIESPKRPKHLKRRPSALICTEHDEK